MREVIHAPPPLMGGKEELTPEDLRALPASEEIVSLISQVLNSAKLP